MQLKNKLVYVVHAYKFSELENHNYGVGAFSTKLKAIKAAEAEENDRGGKYGCTIHEVEVNNILHCECLKELEAA